METHNTASGAHAVAASLIPLNALHIEHGARMVPFAGYSMPLNYREGILAEHRWCRSSAALFDVSHMGQVLVSGADAGLALESLIPADLIGLELEQARYCVLTNDAAGILDDLIVTRTEQGFHIVLNAARRQHDMEYLRRNVGARVRIDPLPEQCLLAVQGPAAIGVLERLGASVADLGFMHSRLISLESSPCRIARSGYTGEDGFELSIHAGYAERIARALLSDDAVRLAGLGARDSLRLEAGLCLYGHDLDADSTPIEADLAWTISKVRRPGGARAGGYPGADRIAAELQRGPQRRRVGLLPEGRAIIRDGAEVLGAGEHKMGMVTSGGFSPTLERPIAMAYVDAQALETGAPLFTRARSREVALQRTSLPFVAHRYFRKKT